MFTPFKTLLWTREIKKGGKQVSNLLAPLYVTLSRLPSQYAARLGELRLQASGTGVPLPVVLDTRGRWLPTSRDGLRARLTVT